MKCKVTEEFYRKRSFTHRYDHLLEAEWDIMYYTDTNYTIRYQDIIEEVTEGEIMHVVSLR